MLQIEHEHVAQPLVAHTRNEQANLSKSANDHAHSNTKITKVILTQEPSNNCPKNDTNVVRSSGYGGPTKIFSWKKGGLQHGKGTKGKQREEDDTGKLNGQLRFCGRIAWHLDILHKHAGAK